MKTGWGESRVKERISGMENKKTQFVTTSSTSFLLSLPLRGRRDVRGSCFSTAALRTERKRGGGVQTSPELTGRKGQIPEGNSAVARGRH